MVRETGKILYAPELKPVEIKPIEIKLLAASPDDTSEISDALTQAMAVVLPSSKDESDSEGSESSGSDSEEPVCDEEDDEELSDHDSEECESNGDEDVKDIKDGENNSPYDRTPTELCVCVLTHTTRLHIFAMDPTFEPRYLCVVSRNEDGDRNPTVNEWRDDHVAFELTFGGLQKYIGMLFGEIIDDIRENDSEINIETSIHMKRIKSEPLFEADFGCISKSSTFVSKDNTGCVNKRIKRTLRRYVGLMHEIASNANSCF